MSNFLDVARDLLRSGEINEHASDFDHVFDYLRSAQIMQSKASLDLSNIETVFTALEIADIIAERPGSLDRNAPAAVLASLKKLIAVTLERKIKYRADANRKITPRGSYPRLVKFIGELGQRRPTLSASIITFNYDLGIDFSAALSGQRIDYGLETHVSGALPVLKLHGSLNWGTDSESGEIIALSPQDFFNNVSHMFLAGGANENLSLGLGANFPAWFERAYKRKVKSEPVIVPPTWKKGEHQASLSRVWRTAASHLKGAQYIFVFGYSLPETDGFFRLLYGLGTAGGEPIRSFRVFDPDSRVDARFKILLGPGAESRYRFNPFTFDQALNEVRKEVLG
jgi:hypothetical protein